MKYDSRKTLSENKENLNNFKKEKAADGTELLLPINAKVVQRYKCSYFFEQYNNKPELVIKDVPQYLEACKLKFQLKEKIDLDNCVMNYMDARISKCVDGSVASFTVDGVNYNGCTTIKSEGQWLDPKNVLFSGYYAKSQGSQIDTNSGCFGKKWENFIPKSEGNYINDKNFRSGTKESDGKQFGYNFELD